MIHLYQNNGYNIVLDVNSGAVHVVDQAAYDVIGVLEKQNEFHTPETLREPETAADLKKELGSRYGEEDIEDILEAVITLTEEGRLNIKNACFRLDERPLDEHCDCFACRNYSRAYLCHLFRSGELTSHRLLSMHNIRFLTRTMENIRQAIENGTFKQFKEAFIAKYQ